MAFFRGPNVVTNGLVLALDAANPKSYVSGSTTWRDLSGNNNSGSLVNGPTFSSDNNGSIVIDGVNDCVTVPTNSTLQPTTSLTLESVFKISSYANGNFVAVYSGDAGGSYVKYGFRLLTSGGVSAYINPVNTAFFVTSNINITLNTWIHATLTYDGTLLKIYINGNFANSTAVTGTMDYTTYGSPYYLNIGRKNNVDGGYFGGNFSLVKFYNRSLSVSEVLQNYNAQKSRFNL
jgi:hypothetical protein